MTNKIINNIKKVNSKTLVRALVVITKVIDSYEKKLSYLNRCDLNQDTCAFCKEASSNISYQIDIDCSKCLNFILFGKQCEEQKTIKQIQEDINNLYYRFCDRIEELENLICMIYEELSKRRKNEITRKV